MNMVRHQTPYPDSNIMLVTPETHQFNIDKTIFISEEDGLTTVPSLGEMVGITRSYDTYDSSHSESVAADIGMSKMNILSPELSHDLSIGVSQVRGCQLELFGHWTKIKKGLRPTRDFELDISLSDLW